ncbi:MAG: hypothetical protein Q8P05_06090 [Candidatus Diapherotrites archaeon]|nr:hypothetical protein [Candidatus Diapherotrites archaeon]
MDSLKEIYAGFDASGNREIEYDNYSNRYLALVTITTRDFKAAEKICDWLETSWPGKKGVNLHSSWEEIVDRLAKTDFQFFILYVDKEIFRGKIDKKNYDRIPFWRITFKDDGTSAYTTMNDIYAKHEWLVVEVLKIQGFKGETVMRWDKDLKGYGWETSKQKVREHAENWLGSCDLQDGDWDYPLIRIADIVANFTHWQLKENIKEKGEPAVINRLRKNVRKMELSVTEDFTMVCEDGVSKE